MAEVAISAHQDIEESLDWLIWQWQRLPEVEREIDDWDLLDQLNFVEEWPLEEMRLERLERYVVQGVLSLDQLVRYKSLQQLIAKNRPIIQRLRAT